MGGAPGGAPSGSSGLPWPKQPCGLELRTAQAGVEGVELLVAVEVDDQAAAAAASSLQVHRRSQSLLEAVLQGRVVGAELWGPRSLGGGGCRRFCQVLLGELLDAAHGEAFLGDAAGQVLLRLGGEGKQGARVAGSDAAVGQRLLHGRAE